VVQVLMTGQLGTASNAAAVGGELYIVMEYLDGISLMSALAAAGGVMPLARALHVALQICDAVGEAHAQGIVHRDIKPENVMLVRRGDDPDYVKVLDFGIARLDWGEESFATQAGLIFGTARYISPEGSQGKPVSPSADVYAIATILYQCLSGRTPFDADSSVGLLMQHAYETPPALLDIPRASYVPPQLATVIMRNLSKSPEERCQDARIFGRELVEAARAVCLPMT
ncbi:MAG TPA: serine/threonine-protein kinase, partial [Polyangiaceae bacterium]|nr:serine/threonine-protein kinase [Polyangiaceae bacterium]